MCFSYGGSRRMHVFSEWNGGMTVWENEGMKVWGMDTWRMVVYLVMCLYQYHSSWLDLVDVYVSSPVQYEALYTVSWQHGGSLGDDDVVPLPNEHSICDDIVHVTHVCCHSNDCLTLLPSAFFGGNWKLATSGIHCCSCHMKMCVCVLSCLCIRTCLWNSLNSAYLRYTFHSWSRILTKTW